MQVVRIETVADLIRFVEQELGQYDSPAGWIYRGQREASWALTPKVFRDRLPANKAREVMISIEFKRRARPHLPQEPRNDWEWLSIGQHHGLPTRLLDWTSNPLAAAYFAVEEDSAEDDSAVWCSSIPGIITGNPPDDDPLAIEEVTFYEPEHITPRIPAQQAYFSAHPPNANDRPWPEQLFRIDVPRQARAGIRKTLTQLGVNRASLFPDLDGIALHIRQLFAGDTS